MLCNEARCHTGPSEHSAIDNMMSNFNDPDTMKQIDRVTALRTKLNQYFIGQKVVGDQPTTKVRDILFLDLALESYVRILCDKITQVEIGFEKVTRNIQ